MSDTPRDPVAVVKEPWVPPALIAHGPLEAITQGSYQCGWRDTYGAIITAPGHISPCTTSGGIRG